MWQPDGLRVDHESELGGRGLADNDSAFGLQLRKEGIRRSGGVRPIDMSQRRAHTLDVRQILCGEHPAVEATGRCGAPIQIEVGKAMFFGGKALKVLA